MKRKHNSLPGLMIITQILLFGFVSYWLYGQYEDEKTELQKDLKYEFTKSIDQFIDSMLIQKISGKMPVDPSVQGRDSVHRYAGFYGIYNDTTSYRTHSIVQKLPDSQVELMDSVSDFGIIVRNLDSFSGDSIVIGGGDIQGEMKDVPGRSISIIVSSGLDSVTIGQEFFADLYTNPDTLLFKKIVFNRFSRGGYRFPLIWMSGEDSLKSRGKEPVFSFKTAPLMTGYKLEIERYQGFLLAQMLPQILFAIFLLLLTGSAFLLTWKSLKKQILLNETRKDFISNISHELKTPVSTVKVALEALSKYDMKSDPGIAEEYISMAGQEVERLDGLISKVLDYSRLENQMESLHFQTTDLHSLLTDVLTYFEPYIEKNKSSVSIDECVSDCKLDIDPFYVQSVMINLIDNSLKYGGEGVKLSFSVEKHKELILMKFMDNGPGIPKAYQSKVFDRFFRVPQGDTHNVKGYGLGLSFSAAVMKQHGGSIQLENNTDKGCVFVLRFPQKHM